MPVGKAALAFFRWEVPVEVHDALLDAFSPGAALGAAAVSSSPIVGAESGAVAGAPPRENAMLL